MGLAMFAKRALQAAVALLALVPVGAGLAGVIAGPAMVVGVDTAPISLDSHFRYLSGLLLAIGLGFWSTIPAIESKTARFRLLTALVVIGGLGRLVSAIQLGWPDDSMRFGLVMELVVTPLLACWQGWVAQPGGNRIASGASR
jgi:hypothetical protein